MSKKIKFHRNRSHIVNICSFLLSKNYKNQGEYIAMCGIFSKIRDISFTLCYNVLKVLSMYIMFGIFLLTTIYQTADRQLSQIKERISKNG